MDFLHQRVFAGLTVLQIGSVVAGAIVVILLFRLLQRVFASATPSQYQARMKCSDCGWTGLVSRHIPTCPKCRGRSMRPA